MSDSYSDLNVLVVDDSGTMRRIIRNILRGVGVSSIIEAGHGLSALERLRAHVVDLVVLDWNMPEMSGIEVLRAMRMDPALNDIPVLMVTANAERQSVIEAIQAGVTSYVAKPFTPQVLHQKLSEIFGRKAA